MRREALRLREKDRNFVAALLDAGLVNAGAIAKRLPEVPEKHHHSAERPLAWREDAAEQAGPVMTR